jgi:hypothetical protein
VIADSMAFRRLIIDYFSSHRVLTSLMLDWRKAMLREETQSPRVYLTLQVALVILPVRRSGSSMSLGSRSLTMTSGRCSQFLRSMRQTLIFCWKSSHSVLYLHIVVQHIPGRALVIATFMTGFGCSFRSGVPLGEAKGSSGMLGCTLRCSCTLRER